MRTTYSRPALLFATTLLLMSGNLAIAASSDAHPAKSWLDNAVSEKRCPATPVNVPAGDGQFSTSALRNRIAISGDKLFIKGTDDPDHIVVSSGGTHRLVDVEWNGKHLGRFGPVKGIELRGNAGDDVLIVKSDVSLPVVLDGGSGDDCVQGGSGGDQLIGGDGDDVLIAGAGRPALIGGNGSDRIVVPQKMGKLLYAPSADAGFLAQLGQIYDLVPLGGASTALAGSAPLILGAADLGSESISSMLPMVRAAGESVVLTAATPDQSEQLRLMLGHPNAATLPAGSPGSTGSTATLVFFRTAPRPGTNTYDYRTGFFENLPSSLNDGTIQGLSQMFCATAIVPDAPKRLATGGSGATDGSGPPIDLTSIANSYSAIAENNDNVGDSVQVQNEVWDVRSFLNSVDYYYVLQGVQYRNGAALNNETDTSLNEMQTPTTGVHLLQPSPSTTTCTNSTTSSVAWSTSGSVGWNETQGVNALVNEGVTVTNSKTLMCPGTLINNGSSPKTAHTFWSYQLQNVNPLIDTISYNQWLWQVPFTAYEGAENMVFVSTAYEASASLAANLQQSVPVPFGFTSLQKPKITSVSPTCVNSGDSFQIIGTGLYPSTVTSVLVDASPLAATQYTPLTDTAISVFAPPDGGYFIPVAVKTGEGQSNTVSIEISVYDLCSD